MLKGLQPRFWFDILIAPGSREYLMNGKSYKTNRYQYTKQHSLSQDIENAISSFEQ